MPSDNFNIDLENRPFLDHVLQENHGKPIGFPVVGCHIGRPTSRRATRRAATSVPSRLRRAASTAASVPRARSRAARCCNSAAPAVAMSPCAAPLPGGSRKGEGNSPTLEVLKNWGSTLVLKGYNNFRYPAQVQNFLVGSFANCFQTD